MNNYYKIMFRRQNETEAAAFALPVNPETLNIKTDTDNDDYNVLGIGQIMIPRTPNLKTTTISSYFPGRNDTPGINMEDFKKPRFYIDFFEKAMRDKEVLYFVPVRNYETKEPYFDSDYGFDCLVTGFSYEERGGETGDFYYELDLTEYRDYSPATVTVREEKTDNTVTTVASVENTRAVPQGQLYVGAKCVINGNYYYTSDGSEPHGTGSGRNCIVSRILNGENKSYPIHITNENGGALGWCRESDLTVVSE